MLVFRAQKTSQLTCEPLLALFFGMARSSQWNFPGTPFGHRPTWHLLGCCGTARGSVDGTVVLHLKSRSVTSFLLELRRIAWPLRIHLLQHGHLLPRITHTNPLDILGSRKTGAVQLTGAVPVPSQKYFCYNLYNHQPLDSQLTNPID